MDEAVGMVFASLAATAQRVATMVLDPSERIFWGFLVTALGIALVAERHRVRTTRLASLRRWIHPSSRLDLKLLLTNAVLRTSLIGVFTLSAFGMAVAMVGALQRWFGPAPALDLDTFTVTAVYTVVLFLAWDASRYLLHRLLHEVPALWELHKVHHSAQVLSPLTLYRIHPLESALYSLRGILVTGLVTGVFFWLFGRRAAELELLGVNALGFLFNLAGGNLRHSHVFWTWGPLERWIISPAQHQLHHAADGPNANLGTWLAIWDRLAGTLRTAEQGPPAAFGLPPSEENHDPHRLASALLQPLRSAMTTVPLPATVKRSETPARLT